MVSGLYYKVLTNGRNYQIKIVNIAVDLDLSSNKGATKEMWVMGMILGAFSQPTNNTDVICLIRL